MKVLILDDDEINVLIYQKTFPDLDLTTALTVGEAHAALEQQDFDLAFFDIMLGEDKEGGLNLLKQVRAENKKLPVVALTSFSSSVDRNRFLDAGFNDFVSKPLTKDRMAELLEKYGD